MLIDPVVIRMSRHDFINILQAAKAHSDVLGSKKSEKFKAAQERLDFSIAKAEDALTTYDEDSFAEIVLDKVQVSG